MPRKSGARMRRESCKAMAERKAPTNPPPPLQQGRAPRKNAALRRLQPHSGAAAFQGVKENPRRARVGRAQRDWSAAAVQPHGTLGANAHSAEPRNRNPPIPPWPPEAATRLRQQAPAAQGRAPKTAKQRQNAEHRKTPCFSGRAPRQNTPPQQIRRTARTSNPGGFLSCSIKQQPQSQPRPHPRCGSRRCRWRLSAPR